MPRAHGFLVACGWLLIACSPHGSDGLDSGSKPSKSTPATPSPEVAPALPPAVPDPGPSPFVRPEPKPLPAFVGEPRLLIAGESGLREFDLDGRLVSVLMTEPCSAPRVLPNGEILFLRTSTTSNAYELVRRTTAGELHPIATLPYHYDEEKCEIVDSDCDNCTTLDLEEAVQFGFDPSTGEACLGLQDSSINMATVIVDVRVDLVTGKVQYDFQTSRCPPAQYRLANCDQFWWGLSGPDEEAPAAEFPFDFESESSARPGPGAIVRAGRKPVTICERENPEICADETSMDSRSRSERFVLLDGTQSEGTYIHRTIVIFDRSDGSLHMIEDGDGPARFVRVKPSKVMQPSDGRWLSVVGESDVRWLPRDRLWIDGRLIDVAGKRVYPLGGDLALRLDVWL